MSARSRYLDAISPKSNTSENNNNEFSQSNTAINTNSGISSRGQQQQIISPSNLQNRTINRTNNSFNGTNNYTNSTSNTTSNVNNNTNNNTNSNNNTTTASNISTRNKLLASAPPPPPPPGPPPKRVSSSKNNRPVIKYTGDPSINNNQLVAVTDNSDNNNESSVVKVGDAQVVQESVQSSSPAKKGGSIWSPKNEVQSGSVKSMTQKLWGSKVTSPKVRFYGLCSVCMAFCVFVL